MQPLCSIPTLRPTWRRISAALLISVAALVALSTLTPEASTASKTALFMANLIPASPMRPLNWVTNSPERVHLAFGEPSDGWEADLYVPAREGPYPGMIIALGAAPAALDDSRVRRLGDGLARMGIASLIPSSPALGSKRVTPREVDFLVEAFQSLVAQPGVDPNRVGYLGICVGSSLSFLAAADERIASQVDFLSWFGGYYKADRFVAAVVSETVVEEGTVIAWEPNSLTKEVVRGLLLDFIDDPVERDTVARAIEEDADVDRSSLTATAQVILSLTRSPDVVAAGERGLELPSPALATLRALSPESVKSQVQARLYIMADRGDDLIPYQETRSLVEDLDNRIRRYSEFDVFTHVDLDQLSSPIRTAPQLARLYAHIHNLLYDVLHRPGSLGVAGLE